MQPIKKLALDRDQTCQRMRDGRICGSTERLTLHHLIPRRKGGIDDLDNVVIWCWKCHVEHNREEIRYRKYVHDLRKECKYTLEWKCRPDCAKCGLCTRYCENWPDGFIEALVRLLTGDIPVVA